MRTSNWAIVVASRQGRPHQSSTEMPSTIVESVKSLRGRILGMYLFVNQLPNKGCGNLEVPSPLGSRRFWTICLVALKIASRKSPAVSSRCEANSPIQSLVAEIVPVHNDRHSSGIMVATQIRYPKPADEAVLQRERNEYKNSSQPYFSISGLTTTRPHA